MSLWQGLRFAVRQFRSSPGFVFAAVLTLGLGIGANATIFNWANWLFRHPIPGVATDGLYYLRWAAPGGGRATSTSWPTYLDLRARNRTLSHIAAGRMTAFSLGADGQPERTFGMLVSANFFDMLGVSPQRGRTFRSEEDEKPGAHAVAVISHSLWQTRLGADPNIVGRAIRLNTRPFQVVGVMPPGFQGVTIGVRHDVWAPVSMRGEIMGNAGALTQRDDRWLETFFRLKPGVNLARAEQDLSAISAALTTEIYKSDRFARADAGPIWGHAAGQVLGPVILTMGAVVAVMLLIACANVGNLLLARGAARRREIAVRLSLGAGRARLIRQLLAENALLAGLGALLAFAVVPFTGSLLERFAPPTDIAITMGARPDGTVFGFTLMIAVAATLLAGLLPAFGASRADVASALKDESGLSAQRSRLRNGLVVAQVALSMLLLVGAGLLLRSLAQAVTMRPGFTPAGVLVAGVDLVPNGYDRQRGAIFIARALERLNTLPGVMAASTTRRVPLGLGGRSSTSFQIEGYTPARDEEMVAAFNNVGPGYIRAIGSRLLDGRDLAPGDDAAHLPVAVVNETMARRYFAGSAVGRTFTAVGARRTIVGVVEDSKFQALDEPAAPFFHVPVLQAFASETNFLVRVAPGRDPASVAASVTRQIQALDAAMPVYGVRTLADSIGAAYLPQRIGGWMLGIFGALALVLAAVGLSGVLGFMVTTRSREFGIRSALGATPRSLVGLVMSGGMRLVAVGLATGCGLSLALSRFLSKLLFGVSPTDAVTFAAVALLLAIVALLATLAPALRAARIAPLQALRR